ncbi:MAG: tRNA pseudouridine(38-40) synthase TruA [Actinobacteria bacterium]|nr:tRNA pseudouridine(38-40) synthase TruA [Actinomycetota bacterium]
MNDRVVRLLLAYDGSGFRGWARQRDPSVRTIEGSVVAALEPVVRHPVRLSVAGRTDAGVHARGQVASFVTASQVAPERLQAAVNGVLGPEVVVREASYATDGFDARFTATAREYRYRIDVGPWPDPFSARFVWHRPGELSLPRMRAAARLFEGEHDFTSFCRHPGDDRSTVRRLERVTVARIGDRVELGFRANAFLHQMVRALVGTLVVVGEGKRDPGDVPRILEARNRAGAADIAPPHGLTLERVVYGRRTR